MAAVTTGGIASIKIDGVQYFLRGSLKIKPGTVKNTGIVNQDGTLVKTTTAAAGMMSMNLSDYGKLSIVALTQISNSTIQANLTNGKSYVLTGAFYVDESELNTEDGSFPINFMGTFVNEQVSPT